MAVRAAFTVLCVGLFLLVQCSAVSDVNGFAVQDHRTHKRRNYMLQRARDRDLLESLDNAVAYDSEALEPGRSELSAFIEDYANMMDDVVLLDKSVETRTRKRGNIKLEKKFTDQVIEDPPCACSVSVETEFLGDDAFPRTVETRLCEKKQEGCKSPYICKESKYDLKILRWKRTLGPGSSDLPRNLSRDWSVQIKPVSVGCVCSRDYETDLGT